MLAHSLSDRAQDDLPGARSGRTAAASARTRAQHDPACGTFWSAASGQEQAPAALAPAPAPAPPTRASGDVLTAHVLERLAHLSDEVASLRERLARAESELNHLRHP